MQQAQEKLKDLEKRKEELLSLIRSQTVTGNELDSLNQELDTIGDELWIIHTGQTPKEVIVEDEEITPTMLVNTPPPAAVSSRQPPPRIVISPPPPTQQDEPQPVRGRGKGENLEALPDLFPTPSHWNGPAKVERSHLFPQPLPFGNPSNNLFEWLYQMLDSRSSEDGDQRLLWVRRMMIFLLHTIYRATRRTPVISFVPADAGIIFMRLVREEEIDILNHFDNGFFLPIDHLKDANGKPIIKRGPAQTFGDYYLRPLFKDFKRMNSDEADRDVLLWIERDAIGGWMTRSPFIYTNVPVGTTVIHHDSTTATKRGAKRARGDGNDNDDDDEANETQTRIVRIPSLFERMLGVTTFAAAETNTNEKSSKVISVSAEMLHYNVDDDNGRRIGSPMWGRGRGYNMPLFTEQTSTKGSSMELQSYVIPMDTEAQVIIDLQAERFKSLAELKEELRRPPSREEVYDYMKSTTQLAFYAIAGGWVRRYLSNPMITDYNIAEPGKKKNWFSNSPYIEQSGNPIYSKQGKHIAVSRFFPQKHQKGGIDRFNAISNEVAKQVETHATWSYTRGNGLPMTQNGAEHLSYALLYGSRVLNEVGLNSPEQQMWVLEDYMRGCIRGTEWQGSSGTKETKREVECRGTAWLYHQLEFETKPKKDLSRREDVSRYNDPMFSMFPTYSSFIKERMNTGNWGSDEGKYFEKKPINPERYDAYGREVPFVPFVFASLPAFTVAQCCALLLECAYIETMLTYREDNVRNVAMERRFGTDLGSRLSTENRDFFVNIVRI